MGMTLAEKILSAHAGRPVKAGDIVVAKLDAMMTHEANRPLGLEVFRRMGGETLPDPSKVIQVIEHHYPAPTEGHARAHARARQLAKETGCTFYEGLGICHQVIVEKGHVLPGELVVGTDSHTCTYGALGAFSSGIGSTDMGVAMKTGKLWFRVPESIRMTLTGKIPRGVYAKDIILHIIAAVTANGATYKAVEFTGPAVDQFSMDARFTVSNMAIEMGAKAGMFYPDKTTENWIARRGITRSYTPYFPDKDAVYEQDLTFDVTNLSPYVATPHKVDNGVPVEEVVGTPISQGNLVSCTAARIEDLRIAARMIAGRKIADGMRFFVVPASREILKQALDEGLVATFLDAGACFGFPSCQGCSGGAHFGVPGDGDAVISTANRNFKGRLGNPNAFIYLASPATVIASVLEGKIADPRPYLA